MYLNLTKILLRFSKIEIEKKVLGYTFIKRET